MAPGRGAWKGCGRCVEGERWDPARRALVSGGSRSGDRRDQTHEVPSRMVERGA